MFRNKSTFCSLQYAQDFDYSSPHNRYNSGLPIIRLQQLVFSCCVSYDIWHPISAKDWVLFFPLLAVAWVRRKLNKPLPLHEFDVILGVPARYGDEYVRGATLGVTHPYWPEIMYETCGDIGLDFRGESMARFLYRDERAIDECDKYAQLGD